MVPNGSELARTASRSPTTAWADEAYDRVEPAYFADGSKQTRKDHRGCIHTYVYDNLSRLRSLPPQHLLD